MYVSLTCTVSLRQRESKGHLPASCVRVREPNHGMLLFIKCHKLRRETIDIFNILTILFGTPAVSQLPLGIKVFQEVVFRKTKLFRMFMGFV